MIRLLVFLFIAVAGVNATSGTSDCPGIEPFRKAPSTVLFDNPPPPPLLFLVCERVVKSAKELGAKQGISASIALEKFCSIPANNVEDEKFCYNVGTAKKDINRLLDLGASEERICKKVKSINPHFCTAKTVKSERTGVQVNERLKIGVIFE
jgi:hypothetical protein